MKKDKVLRVLFLTFIILPIGIIFLISGVYGNTTIISSDKTINVLIGMVIVIPCSYSVLDYLFTNLFKLRGMTDNQLSVRAVAYSLYTSNRNSFEEMSEAGQKYWISRIGENAATLINTELEIGKKNEKWVKDALKLKSKYNNMKN